MARLGKSNVLLEPLSEYLGDDFVLESALVITVDGGTEGQNAHTDTEARQETFLEEWMKQHNYQESKILLRRTTKKPMGAITSTVQMFLFQTRESAAKFPCHFPLWPW